MEEISPYAFDCARGIATPFYPSARAAEHRTAKNVDTRID
jgi:hypothetical protein